MKKTTILLTICLLLTTPYILGGEDVDYNGNEAQVPALKAPKANGRQWYTVPNASNSAKTVEKAAQEAYLQTPEGKAELAELRKTISLRKQRQLLKGDVNLMIKARIKNGKFDSELPLTVNTLQRSGSQLARFLRKVIVASGLSKTQAKKIVKTMCPTLGMVKREARRRGMSMNAVCNEYAMRQMTLHAHLHSVTSSQKLRATVEEKIQFHTEQAEQAQQRLDELGGYISIADATKKYKQDIKQLVEDYMSSFENNLNRLNEVKKKIEEWASKPGFVTDATWQELDIYISKNSNRKLLSYQGKAKKLFYEEVIKPNIESAIRKFKMKRVRWTQLNWALDSAWESSSFVNSDHIEKEAPQLYQSLQLRRDEYLTLKADHSKLPATVTYKSLNHHLDLQDHFEQVSNSWKHWDALSIGETQAWSCAKKSEGFVKARFIDMQLMSSEDNFESLPLLHHPTMIWPQSLSPEWLADCMGQSVTDDESFISISRKNAKIAFTGFWEDAGINNIRELSEAFGLPTRFTDVNGTHKLSAKELRKQWKSSSLQLSLPTGVLAKLGQEFNNFFGEADIYRQRWGAPVYDWKALPVEEAKQVKAKKELDDLLAGFF